MTRPVILVTDGDERAALATVRSLGRAGHPVVVGSVTGRSLAGASRYARREVVLPDPLAHPTAYAEAMAQVVKREAVGILIPVSEASLRVVLADRERLRGVRIPFPPLEAFAAVSDKALVMERARSLGIPTPDVGRVDTPAELAALAATLDPDRTFVLKPTRSVVEGPEGRLKATVSYAQGGTGVREAAGRLDPALFPVLVQERIVGPGVGIFLLLRNGKVRARFAHRRLREKPPSGGVSVLRESAPPDPAVLEASVALLRAFAWEGVAMVEYKQDQRTGVHHLMEINGRLWGSVQLAIDAGVDFPALLVEDSPPEGLLPAPEYRVGVRTRWMLGDLDHLLARLRRSRAELGLPAEAPGRVRATWDFLRGFLPPVREEVFHLGDPAPAWREFRQWVATLRT